MISAGAAKSDITAFKENVGMMGYGHPSNVVKDNRTGLNARAFAFKDSDGNKLVFVNAEIAFITVSIREEVLKRLMGQYEHLGYSESNVFLSAQHTHSAPGGFSHYPMYNFSIVGFVKEVFEVYVSGIVSCIVEADSQLEPAKVYLHKGSFAPEVEVAFNRSVDAYNLNPEVEKVSWDDWHLAVDREMTLIRIDKADGTPMGCINWFGVHCTSVSNDNLEISFDNKGYASKFMEEAYRDQNRDFIALFAQNTTGDVSPNYIWDKKKKWTRGKFEDDHKSAEHNGKLQFEKAREIFDDVRNNGLQIDGPFDAVIMHVDFSEVHADEEFTNGVTDARTIGACHGVAFIKGTVEGPGIPAPLDKIATFWSKNVKSMDLFLAKYKSKEEAQKIRDKYKHQGKKDIQMETKEPRVLGYRNMNFLPLPGFLDPIMGAMKKHYRTGTISNVPWSPQILPIQIITIGTIAIAGIPGEITTIAGKRLKQTLQETLSKKGVTQVILTTYCNAYFGYITTNEEYQNQAYEGGHTVFGEWTLAAFQTKFKELANYLLQKPNERNIPNLRPFTFTEEELRLRSFEG